MALDEMDALIVRNLTHLNQAMIRVFYSIEPSVFKKIEEAIEQWREDAGWAGSAREINRGEYWVAPAEWQVTDDQGSDPAYLAYFSFTREKDSEGAEADQSDLVSLCAKGRDRWGIRFIWDRGLGVKRSAWRKIASATPAMSDIVAFGFNYEEQEGTFFTPIAFDASKLADGILENDLAEFTAPLLVALRNMEAATTAFAAILRAAQNPS